MYEKHFNFSDSPFSITPNPRYLYLTDQHREALAHLTYGLQEKGGFILLTGEVGTGKTTVCRCLLERIPEHVDLAMILTPTLGARELLEALCREFGVAFSQDATIRVLTDVLYRHLLEVYAQGRRAVVVIDEAQNLDVDVLEQLRLLTNLETNEAKLLQIILIGQPEFLEKLGRSELRQFSQRIVARFHLGALQAGEVHDYINHRLGLVGGSTAIFPRRVVSRIARLSGGIPRLINLLCDRSLLGCYAQGQYRVDLQTLRQGAREVFGDAAPNTQRRRWYPRYWPRFANRRLAVGVAGVLLLVGVALVNFESMRWPLDLLSRFDIAFSTSMPLLQPGAESFDHSPVDQRAGYDASDSSVSVALSPTGSQTVLSVVPGTSSAPLVWEELVGMAPTETDAYRALFEQWNIRYSPEDGRTPCQLAVEKQLDCWHKSGEVSDLRRLNRPVILKMLSDSGRPFYAALLGIDKTTLRLGTGYSGRESEVSLGKFRRVWAGEFTVLWKRPVGFVDTLRPQARSAFTTWVEERVSRLDGRKVGLSRSHVYDFVMSDRVRALQQRCGLAADGLVGRETIIMINSLVSDVPLLSRNFNRQCKRQFNV